MAASASSGTEDVSGAVVLLKCFKLFDFENGRIRLTPEARAAFDAMSPEDVKRAIVVSFTGPSGTGKSYLASMVAKGLMGETVSFEGTKVDPMFLSSASTENETSDVDAAIIRVNLATGPCNVVLLDAEGEGGANVRRATTISAAACGFAAVLVMNHSGQFREEYAREKMDPLAENAQRLAGKGLQQHCVAMFRDFEPIRCDEDKAKSWTFGKKAKMSKFANKTCLFAKHPKHYGPETLEAAATELTDIVRAAAAAAPPDKVDLSKMFSTIAEVLGSDEHQADGSDDALSEAGRRIRLAVADTESWETCALSAALAWYDPIPTRMLLEWVSEEVRRSGTWTTMKGEPGAEHVVCVVEREELIRRLLAHEASRGTPGFKELPDAVMKLAEARTKSIKDYPAENKVGRLRLFLQENGWESLPDGRRPFFSRRGHGALLDAIRSGAATVEGEIAWEHGVSGEKPPSPAELARRDPRFAIAASPEYCPDGSPFADRPAGAAACEGDAAAASASSAAPGPDAAALRPQLLDCAIQTKRPSLIAFAAASVNAHWHLVRSAPSCEATCPERPPFRLWNSSRRDPANLQRQAQLFVAAQQAINNGADADPVDFRGFARDDDPAADTVAKLLEDQPQSASRIVEECTAGRAAYGETELGRLKRIVETVQALKVAGMESGGSAPPFRGAGWVLAPSVPPGPGQAPLPILASVGWGLAGACAVSRALGASPVDAFTPCPLLITDAGTPMGPTGKRCEACAARGGGETGSRSRVLGAEAGLGAALATAGDSVLELPDDIVVLGDEDPSPGSASTSDEAGPAKGRHGPRKARPAGKATPGAPGPGASEAGPGAIRSFLAEAPDMAGVVPATVAALHGHDALASRLLCVNTSSAEGRERVRRMRGRKWADADERSPWDILSCDPDGVRALVASRTVRDWTAPPPAGAPRRRGETVAAQLVADCFAPGGEPDPECEARLQAALEVLPLRLFVNPDSFGCSAVGVACESDVLRRSALGHLLRAGCKLPTRRMQDCLLEGSGRDDGEGDAAAATLVAIREAGAAPGPDGDCDAGGATAVHELSSAGAAGATRVACSGCEWLAGVEDRRGRMPVQRWQGATADSDDAAPACLDPVDGVCALMERAARGPAADRSRSVAALKARADGKTPNAVLDAVAAGVCREQWGDAASPECAEVLAAVGAAASTSAAANGRVAAIAGLLSSDPTKAPGTWLRRPEHVRQGAWTVVAALFADADTSSRAHSGGGRPEAGVELRLPGVEGMRHALCQWAVAREEDAARVTSCTFGFEPDAEALGCMPHLRRVVLQQPPSEATTRALAGLDHVEEVRLDGGVASKLAAGLCDALGGRVRVSARGVDDVGTHFRGRLSGIMAEAGLEELAEQAAGAPNCASLVGSLASALASGKKLSLLGHGLLLAVHEARGFGVLAGHGLADGDAEMEVIAPPEQAAVLNQGGLFALPGAVVELSLAGQKLESAGVAALTAVLGRNRRVVRVNLSRCQLGDGGASAFCDFAKTGPVIESLDLTGNPLGDAGATAVAGLVTANKVRELVLAGATLPATASKIVTDAVAATTSLVTLSMAGSTLDLPSLAAALEANSSLQALELSGASIAGAGLTPVGTALGKNSSLKSIDFRDNSGVGDEGVKALAPGLAGNSTLECLNLHGCGIGNDGAKAMLEALKTAPGLKTLELGSNAIGDDGVGELKAVLEANTTLTTVKLEGNTVTDAVFETLQGAWGDRGGSLSK